MQVRPCRPMQGGFTVLIYLHVVRTNSMPLTRSLSGPALLGRLAAVGVVAPVAARCRAFSLVPLLARGCFCGALLPADPEQG